MTPRADRGQARHRRRRAGRASRSTARTPFDVLVVGGGPAGAPPAIYAARKGIRTGVVAERFGGQVLDTMAHRELHLGPVHRGPEARRGARAARPGVRRRRDEPAARRPARARRRARRPRQRRARERRRRCASRTVVLSTGARWRQMDVPGEDEYRNKGVTYCPHCDGPLFKGKRVAVIGGGNSGVEAAIDLAGIVAHVTLIEFDEQLRADEVLQRKLRSLPNVDVDRQRADHRGASATATKVTGLRLRRTAATRRGTRRRRSTASSCRSACCRTPSGCEGSRRAVDRAARSSSTTAAQTSVPGVFAAGDCTTVAVQADRHRHGRRLDGRAERLRPPDPGGGHR